MGRVLRPLCLSGLVVFAGCPAADQPKAEDDSPPHDVQALLWCVLSSASGETAGGERIFVHTTSTNRGACLCLPVGTQPFTGSELDELLHDMALDKCEDDLRALDAVTTTCAELIAERPVDYESWCDPDAWPPPPV